MIRFHNHGKNIEYMYGLEPDMGYANFSGANDLCQNGTSRHERGIRKKRRSRARHGNADVPR